MGSVTCKCNEMLADNKAVDLQEGSYQNKHTHKDKDKLVTYLAENILLKKELLDLKNKMMLISENNTPAMSSNRTSPNNINNSRTAFFQGSNSGSGNKNFIKFGPDSYKNDENTSENSNCNSIKPLVKSAPMKKINEERKNSGMNNHLETINEKNIVECYTDNENLKFTTYKKKFIKNAQQDEHSADNSGEFNLNSLKMVIDKKNHSDQEDLLANYSNNTSRLPNNISHSKHDHSISREHHQNVNKIKSFDNRITLDNLGLDNSFNNNNKFDKFKKVKTEFDQISQKAGYNNLNMITNTSYTSSLDLRGNTYNNRTNKSVNKSKRVQRDLVVPMKKKDSKICKVLIYNDNEILINEKKILALEESAVVYDSEIYKINLFKNEYKVSQKYCQITKKTFKYFKSIYSSTVWLDKPLMRLPIANIDKIIIGSNKMHKMKQTYNIHYIIQIYIKFDQEFPFSSKYELMFKKEDNKEEADCILEFGLEDEEEAISMVKIVSYLKKMIIKRII